MELTDLINKAAHLINKASDRAGAGFPDEARAELISLRELLKNKLVGDTPAEPEETQEQTPAEE